MTLTPPVAAALTDRLWDGIAPTFEKILAHPFLTGLTDGTLPEETFQFYVLQDALYLREYARCLALAAVKAPTAQGCEMFAAHAQSALSVERALHEAYFAGWGLAPEEVAAVGPTPTTVLYTSYLLRVAHANTFEELLGAILPCYRIYWEVGRRLVALGSPNPTYQRWIDAYGSEKFAESVARVEDAANRASADLPESRLGAVRHQYLMASRFEWMFWDAAYRREAWPI